MIDNDAALQALDGQIDCSIDPEGPAGRPKVASREEWSVFMSESLVVVEVSATAGGKVDPDLAVFTLRFGKKCET